MVGCLIERIFDFFCVPNAFVFCVCGKTTELEKQRLAHKLERWGVHPVCILKEVATSVTPQVFLKMVMCSPFCDF